MRAHIIRDGVVQNTIISDLATAQGLYPDAVVVEAVAGGPGWLWDGEALSPPLTPPDPVPAVVSPLQMRRALRSQGLLDASLAYVAQQDADTQDAWEYAVEIRRTDALIASAAAALGKTEAEVDDLFRLAASY